MDLVFDFDQLGVNTIGSSGDYRLLYRGGTTGNFASIATDTAISGNQIIFTVDPGFLGDGYYTIGTVLGVGILSTPSEPIIHALYLPVLVTE